MPFFCCSSSRVRQDVAVREVPVVEDRPSSPVGIPLGIEDERLDLINRVNGFVYDYLHKKIEDLPLREQAELRTLAIELQNDRVGINVMESKIRATAREVSDVSSTSVRVDAPWA